MNTLIHACPTVAHDLLLATQATTTTREQFWTRVQTEMAARKAAR
jgi:hypothetical protein